VDRLRALVWLKRRLWWNGLRSRAKVVDTVVAVILAVFGAVLSLLLAVGLSVVTHLALRDGEPHAAWVGLLLVFWTLGLLAIVIPVFFGLGEQAVPLSRLAVFPFSRRGLYRISLGGSFASGVHFFWYPILLAVSFTAIVIDGAPAMLWCTVVAAFAVSLVVWCHTTLQLVQRALGRRKIRELVVLVGLVLVVTASMLPVLFASQDFEAEASWPGIPAWASAVATHAASVFPPSLAATAMAAALAGDLARALPALLWLVAWTAAGVLIGYRILTMTLFDGDVRSGGKAAATDAGGRPVASPWTIDRLSVFPVEVRAVAAKELRYLMRSTMGKFSIVIMPIYVIIIALVVARDLSGPVLGIDPTNLLFIGAMIYASMFSNNLIYNAYAWEGAGIQSYFFGPISMRRLVLGKNLGVWLYNLILGVECVICFCLVAGVPSPAAFASGCFAFTAALLAATVAGNFVSPAMPVPRDISKITNSPSQTGILASFGILLANVVVIGGLVAIPALLGAVWLQPILLAGLVAAEVFVYRVMLQPAALLLQNRRESLVEALEVAA
jgi:hypothetical protein